MSAAVGLNFPADMRLDPQFGALLGARWLRVVLKPEIDLTEWVNDAHARGLSVLGLIAMESLAGSYNDTAVMYADRHGDIFEAIQCGNEADHESPSSWTLTPDDLNSLLAAFNMHFPDALIVGPGLVSGNPHYFDAVDPDLVDAIAIHPYGQRPNNVEDWSELPGNFGSVAGLLDSYRYHGKPFWITEWGVSTSECSEAFQARYVESFIKAVKLRTDVETAIYFCADDAMVPKFGLCDENGNPKQAAAAFIRASGYTPEPLEDPMSEFVLGFKDMHDASPDVIGDALEDESGFMEGVSFQRTENGLLFWSNVQDIGSSMGFIGNDGGRYRWDGAALVAA